MPVPGRATEVRRNVYFGLVEARVGRVNYQRQGRSAGLRITRWGLQCMRMSVFCTQMEGLYREALRGKGQSFQWPQIPT